MKMRSLCFLVLAFSMLVPSTLSARVETAYSPDRNIVVNFDVKDGIPVYNVLFNGKEVIRDSHLGLELSSAKGNGEFNNFDSREAEDQNSLYDGFRMMSTRYSSFDETWRPVWGEESSIGHLVSDVHIF